MAIPVQRRADTAANWTSVNPILIERQQGFETDTLKWKLGDGVTAWNSLPYFSGGSGTGDVVGPGSSTDNAIARFDGTTGKIVQNSAATIADTSGDITAGKYNTVAISGSSTPTLAVTGTVTISGTHSGTSSGTNTGDQTNITGNSGTATALQTGRTINGTIFDGTANITISAAAGTLTGATLASGVTASSLTSVGTITAGVWNGTDIAVADGGTGVGSLTAYAPIFGGTTSTGAVQSGTVGSAGQVLTSNGAGALPTFQSPAGGGNVTGPGSSTDNAVVRFDGAGGTLIQNSAVTIADTTGDITAGKYNTVAISGSSTPTLAVTGTTAVSGTNTGDQNLFSTIAVSGQSDVVADTASDTLTLVAGSNVTITTNASTDTITIAATGGGGGNSFETIAVSGQSNVVADSSTDTLTLVAGTNVTITTDASTDSITINSSQTNITGNAGTVTVADAGGDTTTWIMLATSQTGSLAPATDAGLTYNATTNAITAGVWNGTVVDVFYGGTGAGTFTDGGVLIGNGTGAIQVTSAGTSGQVLISGGAGVDPAFGAIPSHNHAASEITSGTIATARLGSGTANSSTYLRGDQTWATVSGSGDVVGPASSTDSVPALFDGTTGKLLKNSTPTGTGNPVLDTGPTISNLYLNGSTILNGSVAGATSFRVPSNYGTTSFVLPSTTGNSGQILDTDGVGQTSWTSTPTLGNTTGTTGAVLFKGATSGTVTFTVDSAAGTHTIKLPTTTGSANQVLKTDGSGQWGWVTPTTIATDTIWDAAGDLVVGTGSDAAARLAIGARGAGLYSDASSVMWKSQRTHAGFLDDFIGSNLVQEWQTIGTGGGAGFVAGETGESGIYGINTSTSSTGSRGIVRGLTSILLGGGELYVEWRAKLPALSTPSQRYSVNIGLTDQITTPFDGAVLEYADNVNSGNWVLRTTSNGSSSTANTSTAADTNWHVYGVLVNAGATRIDFYIDGTNVGNLTGSIPTGAGRNTCVGASITKSIGTTQSDLHLGYVLLDHKFTTAR